MKPILSILLSTFILSGMAMADDNLGNFRHVVLFKFKEGTTEEQIANVESEFKKLPSKIDTIVDFEWGTSKTVEADLAQGYTHCFLVTFKDKAGLETYLPHPDHQAFVSIVRPLLEEVHVFDYVASKQQNSLMEPENYQATLDELNASSTSFVGIIIVAIIMIVSILSAISAVLAFLYTMTFFRIPEEHRKISLGKIWLVMVPFYGLYWLYMLTRELAASFRAYFEAQDPEDEPMPEGDFGQTYGLLMCISAALVHLAALAVFWKSPLILGLSMGISTALSLLLTVKYFLEVFKIRQRIPDPELEMLPESYIQWVQCMGSSSDSRRRNQRSLY